MGWAPASSTRRVDGCRKMWFRWIVIPKWRRGGAAAAPKDGRMAAAVDAGLCCSLCAQLTPACSGTAVAAAERSVTAPAMEEGWAAAAAIDLSGVGRPPLQVFARIFAAMKRRGGCGSRR